MKTLLSYIAALAVPCLVSAQLSGSVGPLTSTATKAASNTCNVLDYGGVASITEDIAPAIASAWADCATDGIVYLPSGSYGMETQVTLTGGVSTGIQLDGQIYRTGNLTGGTMIGIANTIDFEIFSSTSTGAVQGNGYIFHAENLTGTRILRLTNVTDFSVHDIALVDAPAFHFVMDTCSNGEVYNMIIRGGNEGGLDGIDVWGTNMWIHDIEVSNKDECVTTKSPASNILVENIFCNWSGGCAIGSLGQNTNISFVTYRNIYSWQSNQMFLVKSNGGSGTLSNGIFENFIGHENAYSLDLNGNWSGQVPVVGDGVLYTDLTFSNWTGTCANGTLRGPIFLMCPGGNPCTDIVIEDFAIWDDLDTEILWQCESAYGTGVCLMDDASGIVSYANVITTFTTAPSGFSAPTMPGQLTTLALTESVPIPTIPTTFFPGATPYSTLLGG